MDIEDELIGSIPIRYTNALRPNLHLHQFPLLHRPLQVPPSAALSGKRIRARTKPDVRRLEVHVPADTRPDVWNEERGKILGAARVDDDKEKNQASSTAKQRQGEAPRLNQTRLRSEEVSQKGVHMLGIVKGGQSLLICYAISKYW